MIQKLTVLNGIIQDAFIDGIPVKKRIITPSGKNNVRTLIPLDLNSALGITNHNTANESPTADGEMHAKYFQSVENADETYTGAHLFVDENAIIQALPLDEIAYHAGDGKGYGNRRTIAVEICENGMILKAEENAKKLNAALILTYPQFKVYKHQDWSGKYCPRVILGRNSWTNFVADIEAYVESAGKETAKSLETPWKLGGIQYARDEQFIEDYEYWLANIDNSMSAWAVFIIIQKVTEKIRQELLDSEEKALERIQDFLRESDGEK